MRNKRFVRSISSLRILGALSLLAVSCAPVPAWRAAFFNAGQSWQLEGQDFSTWSTILGDGACNAKGERPAGQGDVSTIHHGDFSTLEANPNGRKIQAHNLTYLSAVNFNALEFAHRYSFSFRILSLPVKDKPETYMQNLEGSIQLWDGTGSRRDLIVAFSWVLNPFAQPGTIQTWRADNDQGHWQDAGFLALDTQWHRAELQIDPRSSRAEVLIDGLPVAAHFARTRRPDGWDFQRVARVTIEGSSVWVCNGGQGMPMRAEFKDWNWFWDWAR
jgi:hypothetical protein